MDGGRWYATAIVVAFLTVALGVLGVRWYALGQRVPVAAAAVVPQAYKPPQKRTAPEQPKAGSAPGTKGGVSPAKPVPKPQPKTAPAPKPKSSGRKEKPALHSIDLNTATAAELQKLPGIGPSLANQIVSYRNEHGRFKTVAELDNVKGIGPKKLADLEPYVFVSE
jgi:comEA protein